MQEWQTGTNCSSCSVRPDVTKAFHGTWHYSAYYPADHDVPRTVTVMFSGTLHFVRTRSPSYWCHAGNAVYAFFITKPVLNASTATYSQNSLNPYLSVDSPGYGFSEVMGWRGWEKDKRSRKLTEILRKSYFLCYNGSAGPQGKHSMLFGQVLTDEFLFNGVGFMIEERLIWIAGWFQRIWSWISQ